MYSQQDASSKTVDKSKKIRVVDCIHQDDCNWNNQNSKWRETLNLYDSKFSTIIACSNFDKAMELGNESEIEICRQDVYKIVDEAYTDFSRQILQGDVDEITRKWLLQIGDQITNAKNIKKNPRELLELVLIKLVILIDLSKVGGFSGDLTDLPIADSSGYQLNILTQADYVRELMDMPLTQDTNVIKKLIGTGIASKGPAKNYLTIDRIMPIYSKSGNMGFNSVLYCLFNDYYPVGFGIEPYPVHANYHSQEAFAIARHDYNHALIRAGGLKEKNPEFFNQCKAIYQDLFEEIKANKIDEQTFKKELLMLFFIVYETSYNPNNASRDSLKSKIYSRTKSFDPKPLSEHSGDYVVRTLFERKKTPKPRPPIPDHVKDIINQRTILETIDFVKPFQNLGYKLDIKESSIKERPWKAADYLQKCWLDILKGFEERHPDIDLSAGYRASSFKISP
ncbi:MAG: hypothetical protein M1486_03070 [Gammaproteobacteria bacterium]|nr:hypothetical protein [Gammaproteobacteria bacterium]